jgi:hypothetical protein
MAIHCYLPLLISSLLAWSCGPGEENNDTCWYYSSAPIWRMYDSVVIAKAIKTTRPRMLNGPVFISVQLSRSHVESEPSVCVSYTGPDNDTSHPARPACYLGPGDIDVTGQYQWYYWRGDAHQDALILRFEPGEEYDDPDWPRPLGRSGRLVGYYLSAGLQEIHELTMLKIIPVSWCENQEWKPPFL